MKTTRLASNLASPPINLLSMTRLLIALCLLAAAASSSAHAAVASDEPVQQQRGLAEEAVEQRTPVSCSKRRRRRCCGDGKCNGPENIVSCPEDCPGVTTQPQCGEEPHSDTGGVAVVFGIKHKTESAQSCCDKCREHAANPKHKRPCNSWVYCPLPVCWGLDTGWCVL